MGTPMFSFGSGVPPRRAPQAAPYACYRAARGDMVYTLKHGVRWHIVQRRAFGSPRLCDHDHADYNTAAEAVAALEKLAARFGWALVARSGV